jgi:DNA-binding NarL/FixJ family response regulator
MQQASPRTKIHILLVDGRKLLRQGQSALLHKYPNVEVVGEAEDATAAAKLLRALPVQVVIFNVSLSTRDVADAVARLTQARDGVRVLVLAVGSEPAFVRNVLRAGAAGCLTRDCEIDELAQAIRTVTSGRTYLSPAVADTVITGYVQAPERARRGKALSAREHQILQQIADGLTTKEIARALSVSTKTIETHRRRIMEKLNRHSVAELTKYAVREGLVSLELHG